LPTLVLAGAVGAAALLAVAFTFGADRVERGTGAPPGIEPVDGLANISLSRGAASDYDPQGDHSEHPELARLAIDRDGGTAWSTESYHGGSIIKADAGDADPGVGIYVDAKPKVEATQVELRTPTPGWSALIYAAPPGPVPPSLDPPWTRVGGGSIAAPTRRLRLDTDGTAYRYYLVWITDLPRGEESVKISEIALLGPTP
jgi:hypothetical protein